jgi:3-hydroxyisobutyrate dehydrogenase
MALSIAVLGTGIMGAPMARNLAATGLDVRAWNRSREKAEPLASDGIAVFDSAAEAADGADVVLTMLGTVDAVRSVATEVLFEGVTWLQMSTVGVEAADELAELARSRGAVYVDAPVSGTKQPAEQGKLVVLGSGPDEARERLAPIFDAVGQRVVWAGAAGQGSRLKLAVNTWVLTLVTGLAETVALAEGLGVDPRQVLETIEGGPLDAGYAQLKGNAMIERATAQASFALGGAVKDAGLIADAASGAGLDLALPDAIRRQMSAAADAGLSDHDMAAVVDALRPSS